MGCQKKRQVCVLVQYPLKEEDPGKNTEQDKEGLGRDVRLYLRWAVFIKKSWEDIRNQVGYS